MLACVMKTFSYDAGLNLEIIEIDTDRKGLCGLMSGFDFQFNLSNIFKEVQIRILSWKSLCTFQL